MKIDLHGLNINVAFNLVVKTIEECYYDDIKKIQFITGRSGEIRREFIYWAEENDKVRKVVEQSRGGSYSVFIKKRKK